MMFNATFNIISVILWLIERIKLYIYLFFQFQYDDLQVTLTDNKREKPDPNKLLFGHHFSDHMLKVEWTKSGWDKPVICPLSNLSVHPAAKVFHYGIEVSLIRIAKKEYYGEEF